MLCFKKKMNICHKRINKSTVFLQNSYIKSSVIIRGFVETDLCSVLQVNLRQSLSAAADCVSPAGQISVRHGGAVLSSGREEEGQWCRLWTELSCLCIVLYWFDSIIDCLLWLLHFSSSPLFGLLVFPPHRLIDCLFSNIYFHFFCSFVRALCKPCFQKCCRDNVYYFHYHLHHSLERDKHSRTC